MRTFTLRPYQQEAVDRTLAYFRRRRDPALIVLPTGAGKSLVIAELARIAVGRVLVLAHVKELVEQNHLKYQSYGLNAGVYSAGLNQKDSSQKVIFGSIQSVAKAGESFFEDFTLVVIDECHRVGLEPESQYAQVIKQLKSNNPRICILGLTATPYRLGLGWIYNYALHGELKTEEPRFFRHCIYELPLNYMIRNRYLTRPVKVDLPVTSYDFSELIEGGQSYTMAQLEEVLQKQRRLTPLIIKNIIDITESDHRQGVMIFSSTVKHAQEIMETLPAGQARLVVGTTEVAERDRIVEEFKDRAFKYLVNVSVLTTGFDAPHVDVIAILRPTESVSLYQQIIGRGLRLDEGKKDCLVLDYTGIGHSIFSPEVGERKTESESVAVDVPCPQCGFINHFWGIVDDEGNIIEHYGRTCRGGQVNPDTYELTPCGYRFRFKICDQCGAENDISARECCRCNCLLIDPDTKLKQARLSKDAHVLLPDSIEMAERVDKRGNEYLLVKYYDYDGQFVSEMHYLNNSTSQKKFSINFLRSHLRKPEQRCRITTAAEAVALQPRLRMPAFVIARKQGKFWKVTEKIFQEELKRAAPTAH